MLFYKSSVDMIAFLCLICVCFFSCAAATKLPSNFKRCKLSEPNFDDCLAVAIEDAVRNLKNGNKQVGIPIFEPLEIPELLIGEVSGPVNIRQHFKNVKLSGLTNSKVLKFKRGSNETEMHTESVSPLLQIDADYEVSGRILLLPVVGKGKCNITLTQAYLTHDIRAATYQKRGKTYIRTDSYNVTITPERMSYYFDNLFNGDVTLGAEINKLLNENWQVIFNDVKRGYEESFGLIFKDLANRLFSRVPLKDIFIYE